MTPIPLKQQMWLPILKNRVNQDFTDIKELIEITENNLNREVEHLTKEINKELESLPDDKKKYMMGWYTNDIVRLDETFPNIQRQALFTTLMCMTESNLLLACRMCERAFNFPKPFNPKGNKRKIVQALEYLTKNLTIRSKVYDSEWTFIQHLWTIRNAIVHNNGKLSKTQMQEIKDFCKPISTLDIDNNNRIIFHGGFVNLAVHKAKFFFTLLIEEIRKNARPGA
jgi:hypothetical protein